jgi:hypothetical protein
MVKPRANQDPVIEEIREVRHRISERFSHDPEKLLDHYLKLQENYKDRLLDSTPLPDSKKE